MSYRKIRFEDKEHFWVLKQCTVICDTSALVQALGVPAEWTTKTPSKNNITRVSQDPWRSSTAWFTDGRVWRSLCPCTTWTRFRRRTGRFSTWTGTPTSFTPMQKTPYLNCSKWNSSEVKLWLHEGESQVVSRTISLSFAQMNLHDLFRKRTRTFSCGLQRQRFSHSQLNQVYTIESICHFIWNALRTHSHAHVTEFVFPGKFVSLLHSLFSLANPNDWQPTFTFTGSDPSHGRVGPWVDYAPLFAEKNCTKTCRTWLMLRYVVNTSYDTRLVCESSINWDTRHVLWGGGGAQKPERHLSPWKMGSVLSVVVSELETGRRRFTPWRTGPGRPCAKKVRAKNKRNEKVLQTLWLYS